MQKRHIIDEKLEVIYVSHYFSQENMVECLKQELAFEQRSIKMFGKTILEPRLSAWYGDPGMSYRYSGITLVPLQWTRTLLTIKDKLEELDPLVKFNSVLVNYYRSGQDSMGFHADDEKELGKNPYIASVSFGASRKFVLKHNYLKEKKYEIILEHGSVLIMKGETQHYWKHGIPKSKKMDGERLNLTFRTINNIT